MTIEDQGVLLRLQEQVIKAKKDKKHNVIIIHNGHTIEKRILQMLKHNHIRSITAYNNNIPIQTVLSWPTYTK